MTDTEHSTTSASNEEVILFSIERKCQYNYMVCCNVLTWYAEVWISYPDSAKLCIALQTVPPASTFMQVVVFPWCDCHRDGFC